MKLVYWLLILVAICVVTMLPSFLISRHYSFSKTKDYEKVKPKFSPPSIVFGIVWPVLYSLMSVSVWLVVFKTRSTPYRATVLVLYSLLLALSFSWIPLFYKKRYMSSLAVLLSMLTVSLVLWGLFIKLFPISAGLWAPLLVWLMFATQLNISVITNSKITDYKKAKVMDYLEKL